MKTLYLRDKDLVDEETFFATIPVGTKFKVSCLGEKEKIMTYIGDKTYEVVEQ